MSETAYLVLKWVASVLVFAGSQLKEMLQHTQEEAE
jgi:hypothetical protein